MTGNWHYWLFEAEGPPLPIHEDDPSVYTSVDQAREAARKLARPVDIFRTPAQGGMAEFVETVAAGEADATVTPETTRAQVHVLKPVTETDSAGEITPKGRVEGKKVVGRSLELRWNVEGATRPHIRQLWFHPPTKSGEPWRVEARREGGEVLASGMGDPEDAYLELWDEMRPPE